MKIKFFSALAMTSLLFLSCNNDDNAPEPVNEEEVITTLTVTLTAAGGTPIELKSQDLDGDGPDAPVINVSGSLATSTTYSGTIKVLNETESPAEDITLEVEEEDDEHQFFYGISGLNATTEYGNFDDDQNPLGTEFTLTTTDASTGSITFTLRHEPKKPNDGTLADAGGETDITVTFSVEIE